MPANAVTAALAAENTFTSWLSPKAQLSINNSHARFLNLSIGGTWQGTITVQRRFGSDDTARDVTDGSFVHTSATVVEKQLYDHEEGVDYRIGFKTGDYTSGTCNVRLGA